MRLSLLGLLVATLAAASARAQAPDAGARPADPPAAGKPAAAEDCLECHGDQGLEVALEGGEPQSLFVDAQLFARSIHGENLSCTDCHADLKGSSGGHDPKAFKTRRELTINYSEQCKQCHFANYQRTLDSVHNAARDNGNLGAAVCADCHGAHDVGRAAEPRARISRSCSKCHEAVNASYVKSVHGQALLSGESADVPTCTDCHRSHDIANPKAGAWRLKTPEMCGSCHTNEPMMKRYGLSTKVLQTYLSDFHGMTASLQSAQRGGVNPVVALCTDCHGVHDIAKVRSPDSRVMAANLVKTCQRCHPDSGASFPAAWMSHYEPSLTKAPLVYGVKVFYSLVIPFMIGGLVLQILLHLWRVVVNR